VVKYLSSVEAFAVVDRAIAFGSPAEGPVYKDVVISLYMKGLAKKSLSVIHGIGQRAMYVEDFVEIFRMLKNGESNKVVFMGVRI